MLRHDREITEGLASTGLRRDNCKIAAPRRERHGNGIADIPLDFLQRIIDLVKVLVSL